MSQKIRWGVLSTAKIGTRQVIPAMQLASNCEVVAIASRQPERAAEVAQELGIPFSFGSYEELLADPQIDAVYIPLPNHLHVEWSIKALAAGKHVLCEKPIGLNVAEAEKLCEAAAQYPHLKVMEAFMYRHHPQWERAKQLMETDALGRICTIHCTFSYMNRQANDIRNQAALGGGGLMDIGCYPISLTRFLYGAEPLKVVGSVDWDPEFQVDRLASVLMQFAAGTATFTCSTQMIPYQRVQIWGTTGSYEIEIPFNAPIDRPCKAWLQTEGGARELVEFPVCSQYTIQAERFAEAILQNRPVPTPLQDAVQNMKVIEAILQSADQQRWVKMTS